VIISGQTAPIAASAESDVSGESEAPKSDGQIVTEQAETTAATASLSHEKESQLMAVAASMLEQKDIAAARVVYARLARLGSADAAYMLAQSYDPAYLAQLQITGLSPEPEMAKRWYQIAAGLGNSEAPARLSALEEAGR
jgi:TPR repeat protein